jgi:diguanylate cyclase (GGDEF)-like protein
VRQTDPAGGGPLTSVTQRGRARLRELISHPPLRDRLTWREGIRAETLISGDHGLIARTFGTMYGFASVVGVLILILGPTADRKSWVLALLVVITGAFSALFFIGYRRLPVWLFQVALAFGTLMIGAATVGGSSGAEGVNALWCVWVVVLAFLFFSTRAAVAQTAFAIAVYGAALINKDAGFTANYLVVMTAVLGTSGAIIGLLRSQIEQIAANLASEAHTDTVTALANRRGFDERFRVEVDRAIRNGRPLSLVICDLDRFKDVNDELGHEEGDEALRRVASAITASVRSIDAVARLGGEEFSVLLPDADRLEAYAVAERVRNGILDAFSDYAVPVTGSCGVATYDDHDGQQGETLMRHADAALYRAKAAGRNCTVSADAEPA